MEGFNDITIVDNLSTGFADSILAGKLVVLDLQNFEAVDKLLEEAKFDALIHFAAKIVVPESILEPQKCYLNNTANTIYLFNSAVKHGIMSP